MLFEEVSFSRSALKENGVGDYLFIVVLSKVDDGEPTFLSGEAFSNSFAATALRGKKLGAL